MKIENIASYSPTFCCIFKIHHSQRALACFEEYQDVIHFRASRHCGGVASTPWMSSALPMGTNTSGSTGPPCCAPECSGVCGSPYCCTCEILQHSFSGITTYSSGWGAHLSLPEVEREIVFLQVRHAMLMFRVVAGQVAHDRAAELMDVRQRGAAAAGTFKFVDCVQSGSLCCHALLSFILHHCWVFPVKLHLFNLISSWTVQGQQLVILQLIKV